MATLVDNLLSALFGLDEGASQRTADWSNAEGNPEKLRQNMASILETLQTLERGNLNEDWKMGMAAEGPPSWLKGVVRGGAKASKGLLGTASTRDLHRALSGNAKYLDEFLDVSPGLYRSTEDQGLEIGEILGDRMNRQYDTARDKYLEMADLSHQDEVYSRADKFRPQGLDEATALGRRIESALSDKAHAQKMLTLLDESKAMRGRHLRESSLGRDLSNTRVPDATKEAMNASFQEKKELVFSDILPRLNEAQTREVNQLLKAPDIDEVDKFELIYLQFSDLIDRI